MTNHNPARTLALGAALTFSGCTTDESPQGNWSTRSDSVLAVELARPSLALARPIQMYGDEVLGNAALELLLLAVDSEDPLLKANALEALHQAPELLPPVIRKCLVDKNRGVRFIAIMTTGQFRITELVHLIEPLLSDPSPSVQAAALYALKRCREATDVSALADFLLMNDAEVRGNTAMILGELGNPTATPLLRMAVGRPLTKVDPARKKIVDLQIAEAMVKLGVESEREVIRAALFAPAEQGEIVALACQMSGRLLDGHALPNLMDLALRDGFRQQSAEVRMAAAAAIGRIDAARMPLQIPRLYLHHELFPLRAQAALAMGTSSRSEVLSELGPMLSDPDPIVQVAAAGAILRIQGRTQGQTGNQIEY